MLSQNHVHNCDEHTSVLERIEEKVGGIDVSLLKIQRALRVGDIVDVREDRRPKIVFRIGHGYLEGKVRVALLTEDASIWEVRMWAWSGPCSLVGD